MKRIILCLLLATSWATVVAQEPQQPSGSPNLLQPLVAEELPAEEQARRVRQLYEQTKTVKTARDYSRFLDACAAALGDGLSEANRKYVVSLQAWGLNRRGLKRWELFQQLDAVDNQAGAAAALAQALVDLDAAVATDPNRQRSWNSRGIARVSAGKLRDAVGDFTRAIEIKADDTTALFNRAEALYQLEKYALSEADYTTVLRLNPNDHEARTGRGLARLAEGKTQAALQDLEAVAERFPQQPATLINRGDARQQAAQWKAAEADYQAASKLGGTEIAAQRLAWLLATCPDNSVYDPQAALALIEPLVTTGDQRLEFRETLAAARAAVGDFTAAQEAQEKALELVGAELNDDHPARVRWTLYQEEQPYRQVPEVETQDDPESTESTPDKAPEDSDR